MAMDATLLQIFATEQSEHVERIRAIVDALPTMEADKRAAGFDELLRRAHTLKGAARAVGLENTERLVHRMETLFAGWRKSGTIPSGEALQPVYRALDGAEDILAAQLGTRSVPDVEALLRSLGGTDAQSTAPPARVPETASASHPAPSSPPDAPAATAAVAPAPAAADLVRVRTALLDEIVRSAAQLAGATHGDAANAAEVTEHAEACARLTDEYTRFRRNYSRYLRQHAADPELEGLSDLLNLLDNRLTSLTADARRIAARREQQAHTMRRLAEDVNEHAREARMVPAEAVFGSFGAMVRDLAGAEGKEITYRSHRLELQADRDVLQALKDPVMHVLRNAISHGIERPAERTAAGKAPTGTISLTVQVRERWFAVTVEDDGRGLDLPALARQAVQIGVLTEAAAAAASPEALARLILLPGFSTSQSVTSLSGRGFGLSAVAQAVSALQGEVRVHHRPGGGTTITITVPTSIVTQQVIIVRQGEHSYGLPAVYVGQLVRFTAAEVRVVDGVESLVHEGKAVPLIRFSSLLGQAEDGGNNTETASPGEHPTHQAVILDSEDSRVALVVSQLLDSRQTVVRQTGLPQSAAGWSVGAIPLEDGSVAVMLSADRLLRRYEPAVFASQPSFQLPADEGPKVRILVVDDSVTTRSMERSLLEANGYDVQIAVDGAEAWHKIRENPPQLVISDVNMPHMDGFQLLEHIKGDAATSRIPVILVTSLDRPEEQEKGLLLGADAYIVKRKFDHRELLRVVRQIV
jgi:two-component system chemotaxis sensor kinase CheA